MSGLCGVFHRDGSQGSVDVVENMLAAAPHRAVDGTELWCDGSVLLAYQRLNNLPAARRSQQPLRDELADLTVVLHGRIDNRAELVDLLDLPHRSTQPPTDAALVLLAYQRWDTDCSDRLVGDFALVIWDGNRRRLFASRDPAGCIPFYYALLDAVFVFGSELCQVLAHPAVPRAVNEGMVAEFLSTGVTSKCETQYRDISRLPPGHHLVVDAASCRVDKHWRFQPIQQIRYRDARQYQEHFLSLFERAVADRLDCATVPGISLSGGLDSTSVAAVAQSLLNARGSGEKLLSFTLTDSNNPDCDEGPYAKMVADQWQLQDAYFPYLPLALPDWRAQVKASGDFPDFPNDMLNAKLRSAAQAAGVTTLLTGIGSNSPLSGSRYGYYDHLRAGDWPGAKDELQAQWQESGGRSALKTLSRSLAWPMLPPLVRAYAEKHRNFKYRSPFLRDDFAAQVGLYQRHRADRTAGAINNLSTWTSWWHGNNGAATYVREVLERMNAMHGLAAAHPYLDRRLLEFLYALPSPVKRQAGEGKQLLIQSGLLPQAVINTRVQGDYSLPISTALCSTEVQATLRQLAIADMGWVDQAAVNKAAAIALSSRGERIWTEPLPHIYLWFVYSLELWFRAAIMNE